MAPSYSVFDKCGCRVVVIPDTKERFFYRCRLHQNVQEMYEALEGAIYAVGHIDNHGHEVFIDWDKRLREIETVMAKVRGESDD